MTNKPIRPDNSLEAHYDSVLGDISKVIDAARRSAARSANCIMTAAYWLVGRRIVYPSERIYATLSRKSRDEDQIVKYATPSRISQPQSTGKTDESILI